MRAPKVKTRALIFIGDDFYHPSGTVMSSIYEPVPGGYRRFDWGFVNKSLRDGEEIYIRPAHPSEMPFFRNMLEKIQKEEELTRARTEEK